MKSFDLAPTYNPPTNTLTKATVYMATPGLKGCFFALPPSFSLSIGDVSAGASTDLINFEKGVVFGLISAFFGCGINVDRLGDASLDPLFCDFDSAIGSRAKL